MFANILLLAYNGTSEGRTSLLSCAEICSFTQAETHLLAVANISRTTLGSMAGFIPDDLLDDERQRMQLVLDEGIEQLRGLGFYASGHLADGEPVEEISRLARELHADLIIVGHDQKASWVSRWWHSSVAKMLIDTAPCSFLIALHGNAPGGDPS